MKTIIYTLLIGLTAITIGCAKEKPSDINQNPTKIDKEVPVITYIEPLKTLYKVGVKVILNFKVTDNNKLKQVKLKAINTSTDSVYLEKTFTVTQKQIIIKDSIYTNLTTTMANFTINIQAEDSSGNKVESNNAFHVMD